MARPNFWDDGERARKQVSELKELKSKIVPLRELERELQDALLLMDLASEDRDSESLRELDEEVKELEKKISRMEFREMLNEKNDFRNAYLSVQAGAGGTESCDWAQMLLRMYRQWSDGNGFEIGMVDMLPNEEAGIKSATVRIKGEWAYGYLKGETGVHRLVRLSPFDASNRRHTSFASVDVVPEIEEDTSIQIKESDVRIDTYRSSGAGGQHVNVTDSAVRITHIPTGIVVQCQNERSQHKNRAVAWSLLKARLYRLKEKEKEEELKKIYGEKGEIAWGNQIRSYVLHPYNLVKDHRTGFETGDTKGILNGEIDEMIEAYLKLRMKEREGKKATT